VQWKGYELEEVGGGLELRASYWHGLCWQERYFLDDMPSFNKGCIYFTFISTKEEKKCVDNMLCINEDRGSSLIHCVLVKIEEYCWYTVYRWR